jgi:hypothetical protein
MALFSPWFRPVPRNGHARRVVIVEQHTALPPRYTRLKVLCHRLSAHCLPVRMHFTGFGADAGGQPLAVYRCPCCGSRQAWARHRGTGRPFRLWARHG